MHVPRVASANLFASWNASHEEWLRLSEAITGWTRWLSEKAEQRNRQCWKHKIIYAKLSVCLVSRLEFMVAGCISWTTAMVTEEC